MDQTEGLPFLDIQGSVAHLILNAPKKKNALSLAAWKTIPNLLQEIEQKNQIRACVISGKGGRQFCAGADISEFERVRSTPENAKDYDQANVNAFNALKALSVPVIASIAGPCLGGGLGLALAADIRIADTTSFFGIPAAKLGLAYPPEAIGDILSAVSASQAKRLLFTAGRLDASQAYEIGLVDQVVPEGALTGELENILAAICANAPLSLRASKRAINSLSSTPQKNSDTELQEDAQTCIDSADYIEGCRAFLEKRKPNFSGE